MDAFDAIAHTYTESIGEVFPGCRFTYRNRKEFFFHIYYDFSLVTLDGKWLAEPPMVGGPCGFSIDKKTLQTETLTFAGFGSLLRKQRELEEVHARIRDIQKDAGSLSWLKTTYNLRSDELLRLKKLVLQTDFTLDNVIEELDALTTRIRG